MIDVHRSYLPVQWKAIHAVFSKLEIPYIPALLMSLLSQFDARYALYQFSKLWSVPYSSLMDPAAPDHVRCVEELRLGVGFLIDVEETAKAANLDPGPIYDGLRRSPQEADQLLDKFRRVGMVANKIRNVGLNFCAVKTFVDESIARLSPWSQIDEQTLSRIEERAERFAEIEEAFSKADHLIKEAQKEIAAARSRFHETHRSEYEHLVAQYHKIVSELAITSADFENKLEAYSQLADQFCNFARRVSAGAQFRNWARRGGLSVQQAMTILGLDGNETIAQIKKVYRMLAVKFHPDKRPGDPTAKERFQEIHAAYQLIASQWARSAA